MKKREFWEFLQMTKSLLEAGKTDELLKEIDKILSDGKDESKEV